MWGGLGSHFLSGIAASYSKQDYLRSFYRKGIWRKMAKDVKLSKTVPTGQNVNMSTGHKCEKCHNATTERTLMVVKTLRADGRKETNYYHRDCIKY
jgi:hypothetical protein